MRRTLLVLLGFGVFAGYGSAIASARWHARSGGGCEGRWGQDRWSERFERTRAEPAAVAPAPAQQGAVVAPVVVPQAAPAPAQPAPQVFVITVPTGQAAPAPAPQIITVPMPTAAPAPAPAAAPAQGQ
jgi:hypothetical protein